MSDFIKNIRTLKGLAEGIVFLIVAIVLYAMMPWQIPHVERTWGVMENLPGGPRLFPYISLGIILLFSVFLIIRSIKHPVRADEAKKPFYDGDYKAFLLTALAWALYGLAVTYIGYIVSSALLLIILMKWYGVEKWAYVLAITLLVTTGLYFLFVDFMKLPFSRSPLLF